MHSTVTTVIIRINASLDFQKNSTIAVNILTFKVATALPCINASIKIVMSPYVKI